MEDLIDSLLGLQRGRRSKSRLGAIVDFFAKQRAAKVEELLKRQHKPLQSLESSEVSERVFRDVAAVLVRAPCAEHFRLLVDVCRLNMDLSSEIKFIRLALRAFPQDARMVAQLVSSLTKRGTELMSVAESNGHDAAFYGLAASQFAEALVHSKEDSAVFAHKAVCHVRLGELTKALETVDKAIAFNTEPRDRPLARGSGSQVADLLVLRGKLLLGAGHVERSLADMRAATALCPAHPEVLAFNSHAFALGERYYRAGAALFEAGRLEEAAAQFREALLVTPSDLKLLLGLSRAHRMLGDTSRAYEYIQRAAAVYAELSGRLLPLPEDLLRQRALVLNDLALERAADGALLEAVALLNQAVGAGGADPSFLVNRGDLHRALGGHACAILDYSAAARLRPRDCSIRTRLSVSQYVLAVEAFNEGRYARTTELLDRAVELNGSVFEFLLLRGRARYYQGAFDGALEDFRAAHALDPRSDEVSRYYFQFCSRTSEAVVARKDSPGAGPSRLPPLKKGVRRSGGSEDRWRRELQTLRSEPIARDELLWAVRKSGAASWESAAGTENPRSRRPREHTAASLRELSVRRTQRALGDSATSSSLLTGVHSRGDAKRYGDP